MTSVGHSLPLWEAMQNNEYEKVIFLLDNGEDINMPNEEGNTLLFNATTRSLGCTNIPSSLQRGGLNSGMNFLD